MNDEELDRRLHALLAPPDEHPDAHFAGRVRLSIWAEDRLAMDRRAAWRRLAVEGVASLSVVFLLILLGPGPSALAATSIICLWLIVGLGGSGSRKVE